LLILERIAQKRLKQDGLLQDESMNNQGANQTSNAEPEKRSQSESSDEDLEKTSTNAHRYTLYARIEEYQELSQVKNKANLSENNFLY